MSRRPRPRLPRYRTRHWLRARSASVFVSGLVLSAVIAAAAGGPADAATPPLPIPSDPRDALIAPQTGSAVAARPLPSLGIPQHPWMARNPNSNIHNDAYQSDSYDRPGPLGPDLSVVSTLVAAECASVTFDSRGRIVTVCVGPQQSTVRLMDPDSLATIASYDLPARQLGSFSFSNFSGGGYFYLDHRDRAVVSTFTGHLLWIAVGESSLRVVRDVDLSSVTGGSGIQSALPDWAGRVWFVTQSGVVGFVTSSGTVRTVRLPVAETIANSFAMDESGGVFIVSTHALYRFDVRRDRPSITWRAPYDRGSRIKPGQVSQGSGTTPTLIGSAASPGGGKVAITDNADPQMQVLVFNRGKAGPGKPSCRYPVFTPGRSSDENSLISIPGALLVENNYGYAGPIEGAVVGRTPDTEPGLIRLNLDRAGRCTLSWSNTTVRIPTLVSKASLGTGLVYAYTKPAADELPWAGPALPALAPDAWFFSAIDLRTGRQVWSRFVGSAIGFNNNYAPVSIGPDGAAYVGTIGGLVRLAPRD